MSLIIFVIILFINVSKYLLIKFNNILIYLILIVNDNKFIIKINIYYVTFLKKNCVKIIIHYYNII